RVVRRADQRVVVLDGALVQRLLLVSAGVVDRADVVLLQHHQADRLAQALDPQGFARLEGVEVGDDFVGPCYFLPLALRPGAGWLPRSSIPPPLTRVRIPGCG